MAEAQTDKAPAENGSGTKPSEFTAPQLTLPKGGGALHGIGEKFSTNAVTGTGSLSVPIAVSPARSGFSPQLSLSYDSGAGNGVFGMGWSLSLAAITRKTDKGLPQYRDHEESDVFILSGAEDLVPVVEKRHGQWAPDEFDRDGYRVKRYCPRIEGLFARIERWTRLADGDAHWRSFTKDNVCTIYGNSAESRLADPANPAHIFSWLIAASFDDKGNAIVYEHVAENDRGVDMARASEQRRVHSANRYLKRICYGNRKPLWPDGPSVDSPDDAGWMFETVFDFGDEEYRQLCPDDEGRISVEATGKHGEWPVRADSFSSYRSGFEVRTHRLCRRVLLWHRFPEELGTTHYLVRSTECQFQEKPTGSLLTRIVQSGYKRQHEHLYLKQSLPALDLSYAASPLENESFEGFELRPAGSENLPQGLGGANDRWVDLDGEGISGVLSDQGAGWYYKHNLGNGRFGAMQLVASKPVTAALSSSSQHLMDVAGDGNLDLVDLAPTAAGYYERTTEPNSGAPGGGAHGWGQFRSFRSFPVLDWSDPNLRFVDVTGDGIADVLVTEDVAIRWHPSLLQEGYGAGVRIPAPHDEADGPRVVFADRTQSIYLADMSGDGLTDIVRIRNGEVCYWPNLGYGHFGRKVTMDRAPWFDPPDLFDQKQVQLADTDGSGTTDIIYLSPQGIRVYLNGTGNGWSSARVLKGIPAGDLRSISVTDFLGHGTACVVWSSPMPADARRPLRYVDLMCGRKPNLLTRVRNNLGAETVVEYGSSTEFYLADKAAGKPWITRLPFPVHVVKRVETYDYVSRNRFVSRKTYHHGYYDGVEREFRGFARVEELDTEELSSLTESGEFPAPVNDSASWNVPPVLTKTWYHTGVFLAGREISRLLADEYYREPDTSDEMLLDDTILPDGLTAEETREACRSLKTAMLRQEVYALDTSEESARPYTVTESNFTIRPLQPHGRKPHAYAVFFTHARESLSFHCERHYERKVYGVTEKAGGQTGTPAPRNLPSGAGIPACQNGARPDPRVTHALTLEVDDYGNVLKSVNIGYGRRFPDSSALLTAADRRKQEQILATLTENRYTNAVREPNAYRNPMPAEARTYELVKLKPRAHRAGITNLFRFAELAELVAQASGGGHDLPYEDVCNTGAVVDSPYRRIVEHSRAVYRADDLARLLPLGRLEALALPGESYKLAFTPGLIEQVYRREHQNLLPDPAAVLGNECGYVDLDHDGHWWIPSGRVFYSPLSKDAVAEQAYAREHFFLPLRFDDPFGNITTVSYDRHDLELVETRDAIGNVTKSQCDYRVLAPRLVTDMNGNRSAAAFDALGMVAGTAVMGKEGQDEGDSLEGFVADLSPREVLAHIQDPLRDPHSILGKATTRLVYDLFAFERTRAQSQPEAAPSRRSAPPDSPAVVYLLARETHVSDLSADAQTKLQHSFSYSDGFGREVQKKIQAEPGPDGKRRWIGSGWTIFNNKGKPVRKYEPFFSPTHGFEFANIIGVSTTLLYDPVERVVATLHPDHTYEKVVFDPWRQETWDVNDTVLQRDPAEDRDVGGFFLRLPPSDYLPTWYEQRRTVESGRPVGKEAQAAAEKAAVHAGTPKVVFFDTLGRSFLSVEHNRFQRDGAAVDEYYATRLELDIEGHQRSVADALDRQVMVYAYDMLGHQIRQSSMEAGTRWTLHDVSIKKDKPGKIVRAWDSRNHAFRTAYDALRRPTDSLLREAAGPELLVGRMVYGESRPDAEAHNLRGKAFQVFDQAGVVTTSPYDFKGNLLRGSRQLAREYKATLDWSHQESRAVPLHDEVYTHATRYDALNRPAALTFPDNSIVRHGYNEANLLERVDANLRGERTDGERAWTPFVTHIAYDAKGQRELIAYGNGVTTTYTYDPLTFRLTHLLTRREPAAFPGDCPRPVPTGWPGCQVQNLSYTYDPSGNITHIRDDAQQTIYFRNRRVEPSADYTYDAIYRLIEATGREHLGQVGAQPTPTSYNDVPRVGILFSASDGNAMARYLERYVYDAVGNFKETIHSGSDTANPGWTRAYAYDELSQLEPAKRSNRLTRTMVGATKEIYSSGGDGYDAHGNMLRMPQLQIMQWDFKDQLQMTQRQAVNTADSDGNRHQGERTWYVYDGSGERVRKVTELANGAVKDERAYLGGFEIYRRHGADPLVRETLHVMDDKRRIALVETRTEGVEREVPAQLIRYQVANHLGSACLELDGTAAMISYEEYYPYGSTSHQAVRSRLDSPKRYRYTGMERDDESGFSYHGARYYVPWLCRFASVDPLTNSFLLSSPYCAFNNSPALYTDPTGKSGELKIRRRTIIVKSTLVFYGSKATRPIARAAVKEIQNMYNAANATVTFHGKEYTVHFKVDYKIRSDIGAYKMAMHNKSAKYNFIKVEDSKASAESASVNRSEMPIGGNAGYFVTTDNIGKSTTAAHEFGHGMGLVHTPTDLRGTGQPPIMAPRGARVDEQYRRVDKDRPNVELTINPALRIVKADDIRQMFEGTHLNQKTGKYEIGQATNVVYSGKTDQTTPAAAAWAEANGAAALKSVFHKALDVMVHFFRELGGA
jgi:RHS repeat-associated protein